MSSLVTGHAEVSEETPERSGGRLGRPLATLQWLKVSGAQWALPAALALALAGILPWLSVPLVRTYRAKALAINVGWGPSHGVLNYEVLCLALAALVVLRVLGAWWADFGPPARLPFVRPLRVRTCLALSALALSVPLLYIYQFTMVDFRTVEMIVDQENQSSLVYSIFGYYLPGPLLSFAPFQLYDATPNDRFGVLVRLVMSSAINPGLPLLFAAALLLLVAAFRLRRPPATEIATTAEAPVARAPRWHYIALGVLGVLAAAALCRAPAGLACQWLGNQALDAGNPATALHWYSRAQRLDPGLLDLASFHQERGQALYLLGQDTTLDEGLYITQQYRTLGAYQQAWLEDQRLLQRDGDSPALHADMILSLEQLSQQQISVYALPFDNEQAANTPVVATSTASNDSALPWLNQLLQLDQGSLYAHYMRGRILFAQQAYQPAAEDFQGILSLTTDGEMKSSAYTYLAFCAVDLGDLTSGRAYLKDAENLDSGYYNTIAREAASGLH